MKPDWQATSIVMSLILGLVQAEERTVPQATDNERAWAEWFAKSRPDGYTEVSLPDKSRVDVLDRAYAWEVDWAPNWAQAVGQSLYYGMWVGRQPGILLLSKGEEDMRFIFRAKLVCEKHGIRLMIVNVNTGAIDTEGR